MKKLICAALVIVLFGCGGGDSTSDITYFQKGDEPLEEGKILLMWVNYKTEEGEDLIRTKPEDPLAMLYDSSSVEQSGMIKGIIDRLKVGDSVSFSIPSKNLWEVSFRRPMPDTIPAESSISVNLGVIDQLSRNEYITYMSELERKRNAGQYEAEEKSLDTFLAENDIQVQKSESGLRYVIQKTGKGEMAKAGQQVNVGYRGTLMDGTQFDAGTYEFVLGQGEVIKGWDEGIGYLNPGARAILYIPSYLGYGERGSGSIPPFSSLIFEVELLEAQDRDR